MRKLFILLMLFSFSLLLKAQSYMIDNMDSSAVKAIYKTATESGKLVQTDVYSDKKEGKGSLKLFSTIPSLHAWGSFVGANHSVADPAKPQNWSSYDTLSFWIKVTKAPAQPNAMVFRVQLGDKPTADANTEIYVYENAKVLQTTHDWTLVKVPLYDTGTPDGAKNPDDKGFVIMPASWNGARNNYKFDIDKIFSWEFDAVTTGTPADSVEYMLDGFQLTGSRAVPYIMFNGKVFNSSFDAGFSWGQSSMDVEAGAGPQGVKAIKWVHGDEWNNGWTGIGWNISPSFNMAGSFKKDSLKFAMKADPSVGQLRVQLESSGGKSGKLFNPIADNQWHNYVFALKDFNFVDSNPGKRADSTAITVLGFMTQATSTASKGKAVYITNIWSGNPVVDVVAPVAVTNLAVTKQNYYNTITWTDVPNETGETYTVYASKLPITQTTVLTAKNIEVVKLGLAKGVGTADHLLFAPATDASATYYYAVTCQDAAGNISVPTVTSAVTNTAKGVATISVGAPLNFKADGDLSEWYGSGYVNPFYMFPSKGVFWSPTLKANTGDQDLSVTAFLYIDNANLYVAFDVTDDYVFPTQMTNSYENDSPDLFIGLYDSRGAKHVGGNKSGKEPDYHLRFNKEAIRSEGGGKDNATLMVPGANYSWIEKTFPGSGYTVEAKIPFSLLMSSFKGDTIYVKEGYRMPIDFSINDNDDGKTRKAVMCYSKDNLDLSYAHVENWTYTWLGTKDGAITSVKEESKPTEFSLSQNYPNPFNPTTQIKYTISQAGSVSLRIYDVLGRLVTELVNKNQDAGNYTVRFDASRFASGVYFYRLESGSFISIKKMMLVK